MVVVQQTEFMTKCATLMARRVALTLFVFGLASLFLTSGCGKGDALEHPRSRRYTIAVDNQSANPVRLRFDAYDNGYCQKGHAKEVIPSKTSRVIQISFEGCVNGGGDQIDGVVYEFSPQDLGAKSAQDVVKGKVINGSKIICADGSCKCLGFE
jgi:hypothetical protein